MSQRERKDRYDPGFLAHARATGSAEILVDMEGDCDREKKNKSMVFCASRALAGHSYPSFTSQSWVVFCFVLASWLFCLISPELGQTWGGGLGQARRACNLTRLWKVTFTVATWSPGGGGGGDVDGGERGKDDGCERDVARDM